MGVNQKKKPLCLLTSAQAFAFYPPIQKQAFIWMKITS